MFNYMLHCRQKNSGKYYENSFTDSHNILELYGTCIVSDLVLNAMHVAVVALCLLKPHRCQKTVMSRREV